jgi:membrane protein DedA with SNARE-associated domain
MSGDAIDPVTEEASTVAAAVGTARRRAGPVRRLYDWVLGWAETPYGPLALFVLALAESSFFPVPPDPLLIALCLGAATRSFRFAAIATAASVIGGVIGYGIGAGAWHLAQDWFFAYVPGVGPESFARVQSL